MCRIAKEHIKAANITGIAKPSEQNNALVEILVKRKHHTIPQKIYGEKKHGVKSVISKNFPDTHSLTLVRGVVAQPAVGPSPVIVPMGPKTPVSRPPARLGTWAGVESIGTPR